MNRITSPRLWPTASIQIWAGGTSAAKAWSKPLTVVTVPSAAVTWKALSGLIPMFMATRRMNPAITETTTEKTMPRGADRDASWVSSDM